MADSPKPRQALLFVPGISRSWGEQSLLDVVADLVVSLNRQSRDHRFASAATRPLPYEGGHNARGVAITRVTSGSDEPESVIDVYELDYARRLAEAEEKRSILARVVSSGFAVGHGIRRLIRAARRPAKTKGEKAQLLIFFLLMAAYLALLAALFVSLFVQAWTAIQPALAEAFSGGAATPSPQPSPLASPSPSPSALPAGTADRPGGTIVGSAANLLGSLFTWALTGGGLLVAWLLLPPKDPKKEGVTNSATDLLTGDKYLSHGRMGEVIDGDLLNLLDAIRKVDPRYARIDVVSYSLGSIIAFNALFRPGPPPSTTDPVANIHTFVTIGCPFDLVRLLRVDYFDKRRALQGVPKQWLNVYTTSDILGSNFRNDGKPKEAVREVLADAIKPSAGDVPVPTNINYHPGHTPARSGLLDRLLGGFRIHAMYWDRDAVGEHTCFDELVPGLYGELLALPTTNAPAE